MCGDSQLFFGCNTCVANILSSDYGWIECKSKSFPGKPYYFHTVTRSTTWHRPVSRKARLPLYTRFLKSIYEESIVDEETLSPLALSASCNSVINAKATTLRKKKPSTKARPVIKPAPKKPRKIIRECGNVKTISYDLPNVELPPGVKITLLSDSESQTSIEFENSSRAMDDSRPTRINTRTANVETTLPFLKHLNLSDSESSTSSTSYTSSAGSMTSSEA